MNNTIQKLAEKAGIKLPEETAYNGHIYTRSIEKFAELIIQECEIALAPMLRDMISRGQAVNLIKEHFGVE